MCPTNIFGNKYLRSSDWYFFKLKFKWKSKRSISIFTSSVDIQCVAALVYSIKCIVYVYMQCVIHSIRLSIILVILQKVFVQCWTRFSFKMAKKNSQKSLLAGEKKNKANRKVILLLFRFISFSIIAYHEFIWKCRFMSSLVSCSLEKVIKVY